MRKLLIPALILLLSAIPAWAETPQEAISRANQLANQENYAAAISLYEQTLKQLPGQATLKDNLAVLYVNHGVQLQNQKRYDEANTQFDKALEINPNERHAQEGKAGSYFYMVQDAKDKQLETGEALDYPSLHALLDRAIALNPKQRAFKQAKASLYAEEAYALTEEENFSAAVDPLQNALALEPNDPSLKISLANVYLGQANRAETEEERKALVEKALASDNSPRMQDSAQRILERGKIPEGGTPALSFGDMNNSGDFTGTKVQQRPASIQDMLIDIESQLGIERDSKATLVERLETAEKQVHGKIQEGPVSTRTEDLFAALMGSSSGMLGNSLTDMRQAAVESSANSYLDKVFEVTDGKVVRWGKFPLRVYIEDPEGSDKDKKDEKKAKKEMEPIDFVRDDMPMPTTPEDEWESEGEKTRKATVKNLYRPEYRDAVVEALDAWKTATHDFTNYVVVKNPGASDVQFLWDLNYADEFADPETIPDIYGSYTAPSGKKKNLMRVLQIASMLTPGYFGLAPQAINSALQYQQYKKLDVIRDESKVKLGLKPVQGLSAEEARMLIRNMAAKEFAHVLGLKAASPESGDITYPELRSDAVQDPSSRDLETLRQLYTRPANIILNVQ